MACSYWPWRATLSRSPSGACSRGSARLCWRASLAWHAVAGTAHADLPPRSRPGTIRSRSWRHRCRPHRQHLGVAARRQRLPTRRQGKFGPRDAAGRVDGRQRQSGTGSFDLFEPRHRLQLDATAQWGCVFGQLALQRQVDAKGDYWSWDGSALSWRIDEHWRVGVGPHRQAMGSGLGRQPASRHRGTAFPNLPRSRRPVARCHRPASGGGWARWTSAPSSVSSRTNAATTPDPI